MNTIYIDVETTGLNPNACGIIELAYIIDDENGNTLTKDSITLDPRGYCKLIEPKALEINGYSIEDFDTFRNHKEALKWFDTLITKYNNGKKLKVVAYNAEFDTKFLQTLYNVVLPRTYGLRFDYKYLDPFQVVKYLQHNCNINTGESQSLESVCKYYGIEHITHNCKSDIEATRELHIKYTDMFKGLLCK